MPVFGQFYEGNDCRHYENGERDGGIVADRLHLSQLSASFEGGPSCDGHPENTDPCDIRGGCCNVRGSDPNSCKDGGTHTGVSDVMPHVVPFVGFSRLVESPDVLGR